MSELNSIQLADQTIRYVDRGQGRCLLFVHGFPLDHTSWQFQIDELSEDFRVICPDLPGFGMSPQSRPKLSLRQLAADLAHLLDQLGIARTTYCGLSMGGYIGWQFAHCHSHKLEALVACDTRAKNDTEAVARGRQLMANSVRQQGSASVADEMIPKLFSEASLESRPNLVEMTRATIERTDPNSIAQGQLAMADRPDATSWLDEITVPTLFAVGEFDPITPPEEMEADAHRVANADYHVISNAGHLAPFENPAEFNQHLSQFLAGRLSSGNGE
jgi:3-oxoadipate enol-lactonase